jgi:phytoene synthase
MMQEENVDIQEILNRVDVKNIKKNPNILIAASFWDEERYHAARVCYKFMRMIDDLVDDHKAEHRSFADCEKKAFTDQINEWIKCLHSDPKGNPDLEEVIETIAKFNIPLYLFHNFARAMIYDINNDGFVDFNSFLNYSEGASVAPASIFVHLACLNDDLSGYRVPYMDLKRFSRPCALFSYIVHIIRDFQKDIKENLNYFAKDILTANGLDGEKLKAIANGEPVPDGFRMVIRKYCEYAEIYQKRSEDTIQFLSNWLSPNYMISFHVIYKLYLKIFERIDIENGNFTEEELNPSIDEIVEQVIGFVREYK